MAALLHYGKINTITECAAMTFKKLPFREKAINKVNNRSKLYRQIKALIEDMLEFDKNRNINRLSCGYKFDDKGEQSQIRLKELKTGSTFIIIKTKSSLVFTRNIEGDSELGDIKSLHHFKTILKPWNEHTGLNYSPTGSDTVSHAQHDREIT